VSVFSQETIDKTIRVANTILFIFMESGFIKEK